MGVREDNKRETRARLERAALYLFARRGYDRTTVEDVAARAGVSARTAFRHFPVKADLVLGDAEADLAVLRAQLAAQDRSLPALEAAHLALIEFSERIGTPVNAVRMRVTEADPALAARGLQVRQEWADAIAAELAQRRGRKKPEGRDRLSGLIVIAILVSAFREWSAAGARPDGLREAVDRAASWATEMLQS